MMLVRTYVALSKINGLGIFAKEDVPAGTLMWQFVEGFDLEVALDRLPPLAREFIGHYGNRTGPDRYLLCSDHARFMNHSDTPNMTGSGDQNFALRDIRAGEEITCNYRDFDVDFKGFLSPKREQGQS